MANRDFFSELKRRNVYKVAVAYAVVAWLLIQAASILFRIFTTTRRGIHFCARWAWPMTN